MNSLERMKELIKTLNEAARAYYQESREIMTNEHYDKLYDELLALEKETGKVLSGSPTVQVGYEVLSELPKERHKNPALSLDKTKDVGALGDFLGSQEGVLSWKLDGLTVVVTYEGGTLFKAVTRGNGEIGEVVTSNAKTFENLPVQIPFKGHLVIRGEAVIKYSDFETMNAEIPEDSKYKNPRNLCAGSVRQLSSEVTAKRHVNLIAFALIEAEGVDFKNQVMNQFTWLEDQGFEVVQRVLVTAGTIADAVKDYAKRIVDYDVPSDGLVLLMNDIAYGNSLGRTSKFPRNAIAFKWKDELATTHLKEIEWSASRTGLINPVAVFDPVELEGTTVSRASVHNVSIVQELELGVGDEITVYKANMIIPQIAENKTKSKKIAIPDTCPVCGEKTEIHDENGVKTLYCTNGDCPAKQVKSFELFASRNAMNIDGLSIATMEKFIDEGFIRRFADVYRLERYRGAIIDLEGFGEKSFENMISSINESRKTTLARVLYALGIPGIGVSGGKLLSKEFKGDLSALRAADEARLTEVEGIGEIMARDIVAYFKDASKMEQLDDLLTEITLEQEVVTEAQTFEGKTFVITGSVEHFANRDEVKEYIEKRGGKVSGSVSAKTTYLVNNDVNSSSSKNKKAKELGVEIISEETLLSM